MLFMGIILSMRIIGTLFIWLFAVLTLVAIWGDFTDGEAGFASIGALWFDLSPTTLQISEAIVSRYIDPCGLFIGLNCAPFLWFPVVFFFLGLPAVPFFLGITIVLILIRKILRR